MSKRSKASNSDLDDFDRAILEVLQQDNKIPHREIGRLINLSAPAVQRRIKRMEKARVIRANVAIVNPMEIGQFITLFVQVELESLHADVYEATKNSFAVTPEVQQCYTVLGATDFLLILVVESMNDYEALTQKLFFANKNVKHFHTFVVTDRVKVEWFVSLSKRGDLPNPEQANGLIGKLFGNSRLQLVPKIPN